MRAREATPLYRLLDLQLGELKRHILSIGRNRTKWLATSLDTVSRAHPDLDAAGLPLAEQIGDPTLADSVLDRLAHDAHCMRLDVQVSGQAKRKEIYFACLCKTTFGYTETQAPSTI